MKIQATDSITISRVETTRVERSAVERALLPAPSDAACHGLGDAMAELHALIAERRSTSERSSKCDIEAQGKRARAALDRAHEAAAREKANRPESGRGFFGSLGKLVGDFVGDVAKVKLADAVTDLGKNAKDIASSPKFWKELEQGAISVAKGAAILGAACATVASFGAAAPAAVVLVSGVVLSSAGFVESELHVLEACGVDAEVAQGIGIGLSVGGAVAGGAGGFMSACGAASSVSTLTRTMETTSTALGASGAASQAVAGGAHAQNGAFAARAEHAAADEKRARGEQARLDRAVAMLVRAVEEQDASAQRALDGLGEVMSLRDRTLVFSSTRG